jgi:hypothetical protein
MKNKIYLDFNFHNDKTMKEFGKIYASFPEDKRSMFIRELNKEYHSNRKQLGHDYLLMSDILRISKTI